MDYEIIQMDAQTWRIENSGVRMFLLAGTERALLVDSGRSYGAGRDRTHHGDHAGLYHSCL